MSEESSLEALAAMMGLTLWRLRSQRLARPPWDERDALPEASRESDVGSDLQMTGSSSLDEAPIAAPSSPPECGEEPSLWAELEREVASCTRCALARGRTRTVFGTGDPHARWFLVGEGPGRDEDLSGEPFVGRAGQLLGRMLEALGLERDRVYIANVVKCRPPDNRTPVDEECTACLPYLERQIALVRPALILALGRVAAQSLLRTQAPLSALRGRLLHYDGVVSAALVVTYHPAYLLRQPSAKAEAWRDLRLAIRSVSP